MRVFILLMFGILMSGNISMANDKNTQKVRILSETNQLTNIGKQNCQTAIREDLTLIKMLKQSKVEPSDFCDCQNNKFKVQLEDYAKSITVLPAIEVKLFPSKKLRQWIVKNIMSCFNKSEYDAG